MSSSTATGTASPGSPPCSRTGRRRGLPVPRVLLGPCALFFVLTNTCCFSFSLVSKLWWSDWPGVVRVVRNRVLDLHTTRTWDFMQVNPSTSGGILSESRFGEDSIIGVLDTGEAVLSSLFAAEV
jgi:hypothetical protein